MLNLGLEINYRKIQLGCNINDQIIVGAELKKLGFLGTIVYQKK